MFNISSKLHLWTSYHSSVLVHIYVNVCCALTCHMSGMAYHLCIACYWWFTLKTRYVLDFKVLILGPHARFYFCFLQCAQYESLVRVTSCRNSYQNQMRYVNTPFSGCLPLGSLWGKIKISIIDWIAMNSPNDYFFNFPFFCTLLIFQDLVLGSPSLWCFSWYSGHWFFIPLRTITVRTTQSSPCCSLIL